MHRKQPVFLEKFPLFAFIPNARFFYQSIRLPFSCVALFEIFHLDTDRLDSDIELRKDSFISTPKLGSDQDSGRRRELLARVQSKNMSHVTRWVLDPESLGVSPAAQELGTYTPKPTYSAGVISTWPLCNTKSCDWRNPSRSCFCERQCSRPRSLIKIKRGQSRELTLSGPSSIHQSREALLVTDRFSVAYQQGNLKIVFHSSFWNELLDYELSRSQCKGTVWSHMPDTDDKNDCDGAIPSINLWGIDNPCPGRGVEGTLFSC